MPSMSEKRRAIIVDLDGTYALHRGRTPFQYHKARTDAVNPVVDRLVRLLRADDPSLAVLIVSGREATPECLSATYDWLTDHKIPYDSLLMRQEGDRRSDAIVKEEIYRGKIEPFYDVWSVLDDRNTVVAMWRQIGLTCLQVANGDF